MSTLNKTECPECGSASLTWETASTTAMPSPHQLSVADVRCQFVLGCDECSATVRIVEADDIALELNVQGIRIPDGAPS